MNAEKYGLERIYFGGCFIRGHPANPDSSVNHNPPHRPRWTGSRTPSPSLVDVSIFDNGEYYVSIHRPSFPSSNHSTSSALSSQTFAHYLMLFLHRPLALLSQSTPFLHALQSLRVPQLAVTLSPQPRFLPPALWLSLCSKPFQFLFPPTRPLPPPTL